MPTRAKVKLVKFSMFSPAPVPYSQHMMESVKKHFEKNGVLSKMRSELHVQILRFMCGQHAPAEEPLCFQALNITGIGQKLEKNARLELLNQLIMEYLHWYGYRHTMQTFALETGSEPTPPDREQLERALGQFEEKELPMLVDMMLLFYREPEEQQAVREEIQQESSYVSDDEDQAQPLKLNKSTSPYDLHDLTLETENLGLAANDQFNYVAERPQQSVQIQGDLEGMQELEELLQMRRRHNFCYQSSMPKDTSLNNILSLVPGWTSNVSLGTECYSNMQPSTSTSSKPMSNPKLIIKNKMNQLPVQSNEVKQKPKGTYDDYASAGAGAVAAPSHNSSKSRPTTLDDFSDIASDDDLDIVDTDEPYADIPERYYYRELEPSEESYPSGYGEEGPCDGTLCEKYQRFGKPNAINNCKQIKVKSYNKVTVAAKRKIKEETQLHDEPTTASIMNNSKVSSAIELQNLELNLSKLVDSVKADVEAQMAIVQQDKAKYEQQRCASKLSKTKNRLSTVISTIKMESDEVEEKYDGYGKAKNSQKSINNF